MKENKRIRRFALASSLLAAAVAGVYPTVFIRWIVPLYALCVAAFAAAAFLLFYAFFAAAGKEKPLKPALAGTAVYAAVFLAVTPLVNNAIFGAVAPWGSVLVNAALNLCFWLTLLRMIRKRTGAPFAGLPLVCVLLVLAGTAAGAASAVPNMKATGFVVLDTDKNYRERMETIDIYENTLDDAVPQTEVFRLVTDHLKAPLPAGKKEKKVLVLGWDGCRADAMCMTAQRSAVDALLADGGKAYIA